MWIPMPCPEDTGREGVQLATKWGIVSAGKMSHDFVTALSTFSEEEHTIIAVAARDLTRSREFAKRHAILTAYGSYEELAKCPCIDVVYIGTIQSQHFEVGKLMLNNGKSILCEKPLTLNYKQTSQLISLAKKKGLFLMEGISSRFFPAYSTLKKEIESGSIGEVLEVMANFGSPIEDLDRIRLREFGGGSILELGVYCLQLAVFIFGPVYPTEIVAVGELNDNGCDRNMACLLKYEGGKTAILSSNARVNLPNEADIVGSRGNIKLPGFWCPTSLSTPEKNYDFVLPRASKPFNYTNSVGLRYEAMEVRRCLAEGLLESPKMTHAESLLLAELEDKLRHIIGVKFDQDD